LVLPDTAQIRRIDVLPPRVTLSFRRSNRPAATLQAWLIHPSDETQLDL
jgi:hypothetical protein